MFHSTAMVVITGSASSRTFWQAGLLGIFSLAPDKVLSDTRSSIPKTEIESLIGRISGVKVVRRMVGERGKGH